MFVPDTILVSPCRCCLAAAAGSGPTICICGLPGNERHLFMSVLMHFGPPFIHRQPDLGWAPYHQHLAGKTRSQVSPSSTPQLLRPLRTAVPAIMCLASSSKCRNLTVAAVSAS
jgi:hypothetical protein